MQSPRAKELKISEYTVRRLSVYYRILEETERHGTEVVSSAALARLAGTNSAQIRKDLSYFGNFGKRGRGYRVTVLKQEIRSILGLTRKWKVVLAGAGNLGHALSANKDFGLHGFDVVAIFDVDPEKIGRTWDGVPIHHIEECAEVVQRTGAELAIVVTPGPAAQSAVDKLAAAGIRGFLNFAPGKIEVSDAISLRHVDITIELEGLTYALHSPRS
jgi:redox-sensing transcriptional repressor